MEAPRASPVSARETPIALGGRTALAVLTVRMDRGRERKRVLELFGAVTATVTLEAGVLARERERGGRGVLDLPRRDI